MLCTEAMIIRLANGPYVEGVLHSLNWGTLRASVAGVDDAVEFTLSPSGWTSEAGDVVTFDFTIEREQEIFLGGSEENHAWCAAGGACKLRQPCGFESG